jgi:hypothetical protein
VTKNCFSDQEEFLKILRSQSCAQAKNGKSELPKIDNGIAYFELMQNLPNWCKLQTTTPKP